MRKATKDLTGQTFGRLVVIRRANNRVRPSGTSAVYYECKCQCGTTKDISSNSLRTGDSKSCGCYHRDRLKNQPSRHRGEQGAFSQKLMFKRYQESAALKKQGFHLSWEQFKHLTERPCYYCGDAAGNVYGAKRGEWSAFKGNGVDRFDNNKGYTAENCVSCCKRCNFFKVAMDGDAFIDLCKTITSHINDSNYDTGFKVCA
jgi:hypothetical protein